MDAYGIFQGGGAKGYAHVGALKAAEKRGIRFIRYGGTSAGAIIAALAAAGYTADELLDPAKPLGRRGVLDLQLSALLDSEENARVERLLVQLVHQFGYGAEKQVAKGAKQPRRFGTMFNYGRLLVRAMTVVCKERGAFGAVFRNYGLLGTEEIVDWLDRQLAAKIGCARPVTFADLGMRLRVVAANITTSKIETFGLPGDEARLVAKAAMASACFPVFFRPVIYGDMFVDGGMLSNLPAWIFDDERDDETSHIPTFGFRLVNMAKDKGEVRTPSRFRSFAGRLIQTLLAGGANFEERGIEYYHPIDLNAPVPTLSFAKARTEAPQIVREAQRNVETYFESNIGPQDPARMARVLSLVVQEMIAHFDWFGSRVRLHVLLPDPDGRHARTVYSSGMDDGADDHLRVRTDVEGVGAVFRLKEPVYIDFQPVRPLGAGALKYEFGARPSWIGGLHAVPIFDDLSEWENDVPERRSRPFAALVIDVEVNFADVLVDDAEQDLFANVAAIVGEEIRDRSIVRATWSGIPSVGLKGWDRTYASSTLRLAARKVRDAGDGVFGARLGNSIARLNRDN